MEQEVVAGRQVARVVWCRVVAGRQEVCVAGVQCAVAVCVRVAVLCQVREVWCSRW